MLAAYKQRDTVLVGDLAEYEMAPRLRGLYAAICNAASCTAANCNAVDCNATTTEGE
jgi:hypothetical protein